MTERERRWRQTNTLTWWYGQHERLKDIGSRFCFFPSSMALTNPLKSHKCVLREEKRCTGQTDSVLSFSYNKERETEENGAQPADGQTSRNTLPSVHTALLTCLASRFPSQSFTLFSSHCIFFFFVVYFYLLVFPFFLFFLNRKNRCDPFFHIILLFLIFVLDLHSFK